MNQSLIKTIIALITLISLSNCRKDETTFNAFFFANWSDTLAPLRLFIDDKLQGDLPFLSTKPTCENDSLKQIALNIHLKSGKYKMEVKDQAGVVKSSGTITLKKNKTATSGSIGGQEISIVNECAIIGMTD